MGRDGLQPGGRRRRARARLRRPPRPRRPRADGGDRDLRRCLARLRSRREPAVPDRGALRPGSRRGAPPRRRPAGARRPHRIARARRGRLDLRRDARRSARTGARRHRHPGARLARDLRGAGAARRRRARRGARRADARDARGGLAAVAAADGSGERLPRAVVRRARRRPVPRRPARHRGVGLLAARRRRDRQRLARGDARGSSALTAARADGGDLRRIGAARARARRARAASVVDGRVYRARARVLRSRARPRGSASLHRRARPRRRSEPQRHA